MKLKMHYQILIAMGLGVAAGAIFREHTVHVKIVGDLFIRLLKMIIVPLIMASMIAGIASIGNIRSLGRIGLRTFLFYLATTLLAVLVGLVLVNIFRPGDGVKLPEKLAAQAQPDEPPSPIAIITDIVPENLFHSMANDKFLSIIFFSLLFGVALSSVGEKAKPLIRFFEALNTVMMRITDWIMRLAPLGVFALMAYVVGSTDLKTVTSLAKYIITVILGLLIHACITLPIFLTILGRYSPLKLIRHMYNAVATAFSTASSAAALPVTMDCLEKKAGVSNKVASFVLPLGATVNMDGTALYEAVAAMYIAQVYGIDMTIGQQLIVMLTATLASIGAAAIPGAGRVTMIIVLKAVGLPDKGILLIAGIDQILDMCRTAVNVWGDSCAAAIIARLEGETLSES